MLRSRAVKRMMRERDPPCQLRAFSRKRLLDEIPMLRKFEQAITAEEIFLRRVDADELDGGSVSKAVEQPRTKRCASGSFFRTDALAQIKVVFDLRERIGSEEAAGRASF